MRKINFIVEEVDDGKNLSYILAKNNVSKRLITRLKRVQNGITRDDKLIRTIDKVFAGDVITLTLFDEKTLVKNASLKADIVFEDDDVIVFDKPPFMPIHPSHLHLDDTLGNLFATHCESLTFRPINRLDRDTSGLVVVAKNSFSATFLQRNMTKVYEAIVSGEMISDGVIDAPIGREDNSIIKRVVTKSGQRAVTNYRVLHKTSEVSHLEIHLETGRTHQIRVHFSYINHPLLGDNMYGGDTSLISRQALHCAKVSFIHPTKKELVTLSSNIPLDMQKLLVK